MKILRILFFFLVSSVDSPDDGRGSSPCRSVNQLGRRGSYKTSRGRFEQLSRECRRLLYDCLRFLNVFCLTKVDSLQDVSHWYGQL